jgi:hypothetical protein
LEKETSVNFVVARLIVGASPDGLKFWPVMLTWLAEKLATVLRIFGVVAASAVSTPMQAVSSSKKVCLMFAWRSFVGDFVSTFPPFP